MSNSIETSVGWAGINQPRDIATVQQLLNGIRLDAGGPGEPLEVDAVCGPKTINAIRKFQRQHFGPARADGRVDPNGPTIKKLEEIWEERSPVSLERNAQVLRPLFGDTALILCPHGAQATPIRQQPGPVLHTEDSCVVSGCPFPTPCVRVQWLELPRKPLTTSSRSLCLTEQFIPTGPATIVYA